MTDGLHDNALLLISATDLTHTSRIHGRRVRDRVVYSASHTSALLPLPYPHCHHSQPPRRNDLWNHRQQIRLSQRLGQVLVHPNRNALFTVTQHRVRSEGNDGHSLKIVVLLVPSDDARRFDATHDWH